MAVHLPPFPPFGFSVWYDRHRGRGWCWRERKASEAEDDVTSGEHFDGKTAACQAVREELRARKERAEAKEADLLPD